MLVDGLEVVGEIQQVRYCTATHLGALGAESARRLAGLEDLLDDVLDVLGLGRHTVAGDQNDDVR